MGATISRPRPGLLAIELALIAVIFWGDAAGYVPISKTPFLLLVAWASLRLRACAGETSASRFRRAGCVSSRSASPGASACGCSSST
jgi:hypothetical protein